MKKKESPIIGITRLAVVLASFIGVVLLVFNFTIVPRGPVTSDKMWEVLESQGYQPFDIAESYYKEDASANQTLNKCIAVKKYDINFFFYDTKTKNKAKDLYGQFYTEIITNKNTFPKVEISHKIANFRFYSLRALGTYNVAIYVENTAIYAYCDEENEVELNRILRAINYLK